jgi:hypothetical protein
VLFCRNYCYENGNKVWKGWWYPCGGCVGCFLSTACVSARGLADNCVELTTLRRFRDQYLLSTPAGKQLVEEYYRIAPAICTAIETRADAGRVYDHLYRELVEPSVALVESGQLDEALLRYRRVTLALRDHLKA